MKRYRRLVWFTMLITAIFFTFKFWWNSKLTPVSSDKKNIIFVIDKGEGFSQVTKDLEKARLIKNGFVFSLYGKQSGLSGKIQSGTFRLSPSQSSREILQTLTSQPLDNWITLLEGLRIEEMSQKLGDEFLKYAKEGYMFPDTYLFPKDYSAEQIATRLKDTFDQKYSDELRSKIKSLGLTEAQGVILASIVEREARSDEVRRMVASILLKRFKIGMALNADATVQYALGYQPSEKSWWKRHLTHEDLKVNSSYNTYIHSGFPPKPIANPSLASLKAVADADPSIEYLYYYHDSKGNSYYGKTLEEHNQNVANNP